MKTSKELNKGHDVLFFFLENLCLQVRAISIILTYCLQVSSFHVVTESSLYTVSGIVFFFGYSELRNKTIRQVVAYERLKTM